MSFAQSIYGNARRLVANSEKAPQYAQAAMAGAAVFGGYGGAKGAVSSDSTVVGGGVGGAMFVALFVYDSMLPFTAAAKKIVLSGSPITLGQIGRF